jgi:hypothetical protein
MTLKENQHQYKSLVIEIKNSDKENQGIGFAIYIVGNNGAWTKIHSEKGNPKSKDDYFKILKRAQNLIDEKFQAMYITCKFRKIKPKGFYKEQVVIHQNRLYRVRLRNDNQSITITDGHSDHSVNAKELRILVGDYNERLPLFSINVSPKLNKIDSLLKMNEIYSKIDFEKEYNFIFHVEKNFCILNDKRI